MTYKIQIENKSIEIREIEADSQEEAIAKVKEGGGTVKQTQSEDRVCAYCEDVTD